jgi:hypothetical protein
MTEPRSTAGTNASTIQGVTGSVEFTDASGMRWSVWEIANPGFSDRLISLFPHPERRAGWLLFESASGERRRLSPYPENWRSLGSVALSAQCVLAMPPGRNEKRRRTDER